MTQRDLGWIQGVAWAAGFVSSPGGHIRTDEIVTESGISLEDFRVPMEYDLGLIRDANPELRLPRGKE
ncbi:hypothetical protein R70199_07850 [Paraburkholderia domus]|nr:hypothetical protein R70199_07850 [Paraburkholderia domus]